MIRSREPFKFVGTTISLERLIVSGAVNLVGQSVWKTVDAVTVVGHQFITLSVDICVQHSGPEALRRAGLSAERRLVSTGVYK